jgi:hypothetical protein
MAAMADLPPGWLPETEREKREREGREHQDYLQRRAGELAEEMYQGDVRRLVRMLGDERVREALRAALRPPATGNWLAAYGLSMDGQGRPFRPQRPPPVPEGGGE